MVDEVEEAEVQAADQGRVDKAERSLLRDRPQAMGRRHHRAGRNAAGFGFGLTARR